MTDKTAVIENYKNAYRLVHGKSVKIYESGSWFYIGRRTPYSAYRLKDIGRMTDELMKRAQKLVAS